MRNEPEGWWPWGLLPLLGLLILFLWGLFRTAPNIESRTQAGVSSVLVEAGYSGLDVSANGQHVLVSGSAPATEVSRIRSIARGATCDSFVAKGLVCPTHVDVEIAGSSGADARRQSAGQAAAGTPGAVADTRNARAHNFSFLRSAERTILRGDVPDAATRDQLLSSARSRFDNVIDSLVVTGSAATAGFAWATDKAWSVLEGAVAGRVSWTDGILSATIRTNRDNLDGVRAAFADATNSSRLGELRVQVAEDVERCNTEFRAAMGSSQIQFNTGSATISPASQELLQRIAAVATSCSDELQVEGHTDNVGSDALNRDLSRRRAQAVVAALVGLGVERSRIKALGYGEDRPVATNETAAGRAENRRIEIKIADI